MIDELRSRLMVRALGFFLFTGLLAVALTGSIAMPAVADTSATRAALARLVRAENRHNDMRVDHAVIVAPYALVSDYDYYTGGMALYKLVGGGGGAFRASDLTTLYHVPAATATTLINGLYSAPGL